MSVQFKPSRLLNRAYEKAANEFRHAVSYKEKGQAANWEERLEMLDFSLSQKGEP